jgi:hypothetical protein
MSETTEVVISTATTSTTDPTVLLDTAVVIVSTTVVVILLLLVVVCVVVLVCGSLCIIRYRKRKVILQHSKVANHDKSEDVLAETSFTSTNSAVKLEDNPSYVSTTVGPTPSINDSEAGIYLDINTSYDIVHDYDTDNIYI